MDNTHLGIVLGITGISTSAVGIAAVVRLAQNHPTPLLCQVFGHKDGTSFFSEEGDYYGTCVRCSATHPKIRR